MKNSFTLLDLAEYLGAKWHGDPAVEVSAIANLAKARTSDLSFLSNPKYAHFLGKSSAGIVILKTGTEIPKNFNVLFVENPYLAYAKVSVLFCRRHRGDIGVHPSAKIDPSATVAPSAIIGPHCSVGPNSVIGAKTELAAGVVVGSDSIVGDHCLLHANVVLYHGVTLGDRVTIHSSTVIGSDGFGFAPSAEGWVKIHQLGGVVIGNDVEIGASCSIDRGAIDDTVIEAGVIIDNQVHIAHNVTVGQRTAIAGCTGVAGSTHIGADCTLGGFVAVSGHLTITDKAHFNGSTVVTKSIHEPGHYASGTILQDVKTWRRNAVRFGQLDNWVMRIKKLEQADNS